MVANASLKKLALLVTSDRYLDTVKGVFAQTGKENIELACFLTGGGVRALRDPDLLAMVRRGVACVGVCELSWEREHMGERLEDIAYGSQYQNSQFVAWADKVLVL